MPEMVLPLKLVCSTGMWRIQLVRLRLADLVDSTLTIISRKGGGKRTPEQRRCDRADRLLEKLVRGTKFERLDGYHVLRHSFISILVSQGKTWDQIAAFVGHLDKRTPQRYIHFLPKDKNHTVESVPFEF